MVHAWWDAHCKAVGLRLRFDGMGGHRGNRNGDCCVRSCEVASLVHAHLGCVWKDNIERHIFQNLDSVFSSRNERLFCHIWDAVPLRDKEKKNCINYTADFFTKQELEILLSLLDRDS